MKKFLSFLLCLLLFSGCSQPAAEKSSTPTVEATATSAIEATTAPETTPTHSAALPQPPSILKGETSAFENILTFHFASKNDAILKTPKDFATEQELNEFIYQDCLRRHENLKCKKPDALYLHISLMGHEWVPHEFSEIEPIDMDVILTDKELIDEWFSVVKTVNLKRNERYHYDEQEYRSGIGPDITYCYKDHDDIIELFTDNFQYYYPNDVKIHDPVTYADWDKETQKRYEEFENKIYQLAADKFKAAYEQAANYPFLN